MTRDLEHHGCAARMAPADGFTLPGAEPHYPPDLELEPVHLDIDLAVDLVLQSLAGTVTTTVRAARDGVAELRLDAVDFEDLALEDADGGELDWSYDGRQVAIHWRSLFRRGETRRVALRYALRRPESGLYFSKPDEAYPEAPWYAATDHETERARHWLPCVDLPNARPRLDFHLRAAERYTILANGALVGQTNHEDGTKTAHWRLDFPCPSYLTCFAIGDFVAAEDGAIDGIPVAAFACPPHSEADLRRSFGRTRAMLAWMTQKLGMPFPFPKYYQVALPGIGGAMENISLVVWDDAYVMDASLAQEWTRLVDEINLHEMAHSYFGDAVVCRDYAHAWLKESWATYMEQVWFEDTLGEEERGYQFLRDADAYFEEADERYQRPIVTRDFNSSWQLYDRHLYPGGACRLHTLRAELGDEAFWSGVRDYLQRYRGAVVETDDFRRVMEAHSGRSLGRFFDQWFHRAGYPAIRVTFKYDARRREGSFELNQTQADAKTGEPVFHLATELAWVIDGRTTRLPIRLERARHSFVVPMAAEPEQIRFDPDGKLLHKLDFNPGDPKLRVQLVAAPDVTGRILAGRELAKTGKRANLEAIGAAWPEEPFWGVRLEWGKALAKAGTGSAIAVLADMIAGEADPRALAPLIRAAAGLRDARLAAAIETRLDEGLPYHATAAAYEALGAQRDQAPFERLAEAAEREGYAGIAQAGAFRGLAASRNEAAIPLLLEAVGYGASASRARPAAVGALAEIGRLQAERGAREEIVEQMVDLLRDPDRRARWAAAQGLRTLAAGRAIRALEAFAAPLAAQEQVGVRKIVAGIRKAQEPKAAEGEARVAELEEKLRQLGARVEDLEARLGAPANGAAARGDVGDAGSGARSGSGVESGGAAEPGASSGSGAEPGGEAGASAGAGAETAP